MFWGSSKGSGEAIGQLQILHPPVVSSDFFGRAIQPYEAHRLLGDVDRIQPAQDSTPHSSQYSFLPCPETQNNAGLLLRRLCRRNGGWKVARLLNQRRGSLPSLPLAVDREILSLLMGGSRQYVYAYSNTYELVPASYQQTPLLVKTVATRIFGSGRCFYAHAKSDVNPLPLRWDESAPWQFVLKMEEVGREGWQLLEPVMNFC
jgi:hypothetical protein